jgi:hypothetical protein
VCKFSAIVAIFSLCLGQHAQSDEISVTNQNCVWQGFARTNQAKFSISFRVEGHTRGCSRLLQSLDRAGRNQTVKVPPLAECNYFYCKGGCYYTVEAEGVAFGKAGSIFMCSLDWAGVCQCQPQ